MLYRVLGTLGRGSPAMKPIRIACPSPGIILHMPWALMPGWEHQTPAPTMRGTAGWGAVMYETWQSQQWRLICNLCFAYQCGPKAAGSDAKMHRSSRKEGEHRVVNALNPTPRSGPPGRH